MATFVPFAILRMIPAVEAGAVAHLDGLRQRGTAALTRGIPRTAASHALHEGLGMLGDSKLMAVTAAAAGGHGGGGSEAAGSAAAGGGDVVGGGSDADGDGDGDEGSGPGVPFAQGDPDSERVYDELVAQGVRPRPKGAKPVLARSGSSSGGASTDGDASRTGAQSVATGFEPDPADRVGARLSTGLRARIGPATREDAWMWEGVPPGRGLIRSYEPGERRYYMDDNGGPCVRELPRAWPPGEGPHDGAAT
jgi:hypothetical protein